MPGRHQNDERTYRGLATYKERVQAFNAASMKLVEYTRVQIELDDGSERSPAEIVAARIKTLEKTIGRIRTLA